MSFQQWFWRNYDDGCDAEAAVFSKGDLCAAYVEGTKLILTLAEHERIAAVADEILQQESAAKGEASNIVVTTKVVASVFLAVQRVIQPGGVW